MNAERWKRKSIPASVTTASASEPLLESSKDFKDPVDSRKPRVLTKALRTLSSSSLESISQGTSRNGSSIRRLQKTPSNSGSMIERLHRRVSKDSAASSPSSETPNNSLDQPLHAMEVVHYGHLKVDVTLLKARSEYLVLTDQCLVKLGSVEAARSVFPQLMHQNGDTPPTGSPQLPALTSRAAMADVRLEIPLKSIVAAFNEEGSSPRFGIEVWWSSPWPRLSYCKAHFFFALPKERDDWLTSIQRACRARLRKAPATTVIPENLKTRINHIVSTTEAALVDGAAQNLIFPVTRRTVGSSQKGNGTEDAQAVFEISSTYLVIGPCMCYFLEVLRADQMTPPGELRVKVKSFGTVTLTRFRASVASHEQRFVICFRAPFDREFRLDLASAHYRRVIETLTRVDRILKPMWPQHFQQAIFEIQGLPPPLHLTSGNDLGGLERSLQAYCTAYGVQEPNWTIEWNTPSQAAFRLLPSEGHPYSAPQLLACFRALRYNSFFKAISIRDVDISALAGKKDHPQYGDVVVHTSLNASHVSDEHHDLLAQAPVLSQEIHALLFASESIRTADFSNVFGSVTSRNRQSRTQSNHSATEKMTSEMLKPILMLLRWQLFHCRSLSLTDNPLAAADVEELANLLVLDHVRFTKLNLARCCLGDGGLTRLWSGMPGQASVLETIDTSDNQGIVRFEVISKALNQLRSVKKLRIAGNTRLTTNLPLVEEETINGWELQELDLSGIALNDATVDVLSNYLQTSQSQRLDTLRLNRCGLTGRQIARLFRGMGQARQITVHLNSSRLDEGIDDLCGAVACGYGPLSLFMQMVEFNYDASYVKLWRALTVNKTIECLSLVGSATPDSVSHTACQAVSEFFMKNTTVRFLDISGYHAKLDEGRLGPEFSTALIGMRSNTRIEHLRVRSQMLNVNIGDLAEAISGNETLHTLDCEGNDFNLSNFRHLVKHLKENKSIRYFSAFSEQDLDRTIRKAVDTVGIPPPTRRGSVMSRLRHDRHEKHDKAQSSEVSWANQLKHEWNAVSNELHELLDRNRKLHEDSGSDTDSTSGSNMQPVARHNFSKLFGGLALKEFESRRRAGSTDTGDHRRSGASSQDIPNSQVNFGDREGGIARSSSVASSDVALSPASELGSTDSDAPSPPEPISPTKKVFEIGSSESPELGSESLFDENYTLGGDGVAEDHGLRMKSYRRFQTDLTGPIDEEDDDGYETSKESL